MNLRKHSARRHHDPSVYQDKRMAHHRLTKYSPLILVRLADDPDMVALRLFIPVLSVFHPRNGRTGYISSSQDLEHV